jgi:CrcB protein
LVNVSGCALIGFLASMGKTQWYFGPDLRAFLFIGFLGAYTTFSTYMLESYELFNRGEISWGLLNLGGSVLLGLLGFFLGVLAARFLTV